jgi:hypothetical protein
MEGAKHNPSDHDESTLRSAPRHLPNPGLRAYEKGFFADEGLDAQLSITPTAWMVPEQLLNGQSEFAILPWTRVAAAERGEAPLKLLCGSGCEEAVIVVRMGFTLSAVRSVAIPREGGMKDLTAMGLIDSLGWSQCELRRFPSGDGAIIAFVARSTARRPARETA